MNEFSEAKKLLEKMEPEVIRTDWADPEDVAYHRRERRLLKRLAAIPEDRRCSCGHLRPDSSQWVVTSRRVCCRSCYMRDEKVSGEVELLEEGIFGEVEVRLEFSGRALVSVRKRSGLSQAEFARRAGWSRSRQRDLESGRVVSVSVEVADTMLVVLRERGFETSDEIPLR